MGYIVSSVLAIGNNDSHDSFIYYLPTSRVRYEWINDWVYQRFNSLATKLGPTAVIVAPPPVSVDEYWESLESEFGVGSSFCPVDESFGHTEGVLHSRLPFFIVSRRPIGAVNIHDVAPFGIISLAGLDEVRLTQLVDSLVEVARRGGDLVECAPQLDAGISGEMTKDEWTHAVARAIEIKPHIFGIGLNVGSILSWFCQRKTQITQSTRDAETSSAQELEGR